MKKSLGIYIHIPFCVKKCLYCDFLSFSCTEEEQESYVDALLEEIQLETQTGAFEQFDVRTIFIGGGTPSILSVPLLEKILCKLKNCFVFDCLKELEVTIEINPGTVTEEKLLAYQNMGINRISFGLQSTNNDELRTLGRIHTYEQFVESYEFARKVGFYNINVDLMSALPAQTVESYRTTLETVAKLSPEHISAYSLIIEEGTPFFKRYAEGENENDGAKNDNTVCALPSEDEERTMYEDTKTILATYGYHRYEISNYAKDLQECIHNSNYWRRKDYVGFGIGAASLVNNCRYSNTNDIDMYVNQRNFKKEQVQQLKVLEQMEEFMFLGLRFMQGVSQQDFYELFGQAMMDVYGTVIHKLVQQQLLVNENGVIFLTDKGISISNYVMAEFLL